MSAESIHPLTPRHLLAGTFRKGSRVRVSDEHGDAHQGSEGTVISRRDTRNDWNEVQLTDAEGTVSFRNLELEELKK